MNFEPDFIWKLRHNPKLRSLLGEEWPLFNARLEELSRAIALEDKEQAGMLVDKLVHLIIEHPDLLQILQVLHELIHPGKEEADRPGKESFPILSRYTAIDDLYLNLPNLKFKLELPQEPQASSQPPLEKPRPEFLCKLRGDKVYQKSSVMAEAEVDLVFYLGKPDQETIARLQGEHLDKALTDGGELGIFLVPVGFRLGAGDCYWKVEIKSWEMPEVVFHLTAGAVKNLEAGAWVYLYLNGALIYAFFLKIPVIDDPLDAGPVHNELPAIDLDASGVPTQARLVLTQDGDDLLISYCNYKTGFSKQQKLKKLTLPKLKEALNGVQDLAKPAATSQLWQQFPDPFGFAASDSQQRGLDDLMNQVAKAGWELWSQLIADGDLGEVLEDLNRLSPQSHIEVVTDSAFLPWEIIYPENITALGLKPGLFWGARFLIQSTLPEKKDLLEEKRTHEASAAQAYICINPAIDNNFPDLAVKPAASHVEWAQPRGASVSVEEPPAAREILLGKREEKKWLYFFCHGRGGANEALELGSGQQYVIGPRDLRQTKAFKGRPIVFLNSCSSGAYAPLLLTNYYKEFRESKKVLGLIGTSFPVPAVTAAAIGQRLTQEYLDGKDDLGDIIFRLRQQLLAKGVPIGLFYTLHCYSDIRALPKPQGG